MKGRDLTRRATLRYGTAGLLGGVGVSGRALGATLSNRIVVSGRQYDGSATYEFEVSGSVDTIDSPAGDHAEGSRAWGAVRGWKDGYRFSGEVTSFSYDGPLDVYVNGTQVDPSTLGADGRRIEIRGTGSTATYEFSVSGEVTGGDGLTAPDSYSGGTASGEVGGWADAYTFTGEITSFSRDGSLRVFVDGEEVDPSTLGADDGETKWRKLVVSNEGFDEEATYEFEVSGSVDTINSPPGDHAEGSRAWGEVRGWKDGYRFSGEVVSFSHDGPVRVSIDEEETDPSRFGGGAIDPKTVMRTRGRPVHDMDDWAAWSSADERTTTTADSEVSYRGSTSLRLETTANNLDVRYDPDSPLDLSGKRLSLALKWAAPTSVGHVYLALVDSAGNRSEFVSRIASGMRGSDQGWIRCPVATDLDGSDDATLDDIASIRLSLWASGEGRVWVDDIRFHEQADRGQVVFTFDDSPKSRRKAIDILDERGVTGTLFTMSHHIGNHGWLDLSDLNAAKEAGWDVASHPQHPDSLSEMTASEAADAMDADRKWLRDHGFDPEVMSWPYGAFDTDAVKTANERYDLVFSTQGAPSASEVSAPMNAGRIDGSSNGKDPDHIPDAAKEAIDRAEEFGELSVLMYHDVDTGDPWSIPGDLLAETVDYALNADVDIVTCTDLLP